MNNFIRINTISLNFEAVKEKISIQDFMLFTLKKLNLKKEDILSFELHGSHRVFVKLSNEKLLEDIFEKDLDLKFKDSDGVEQTVYVCNESIRNIVKIHRVPLEVSDLEIRKAFDAYGVVTEIRKEIWKGLPLACYSGTRSIKMEIHKAIPSYVFVKGRSFWTTYYGQKRTCRKCHSTEHEVKDCTFTVNQRLQVPRNFAEAVSQGTDGIIGGNCEMEVDRREVHQDKIGLSSPKEINSELGEASGSFKPNQEHEKQEHNRKSKRKKKTGILADESEISSQEDSKCKKINVDKVSLLNKDEVPAVANIACMEMTNMLWSEEIDSQIIMSSQECSVKPVPEKNIESLAGAVLDEELPVYLNL